MRTLIPGRSSKEESIGFTLIELVVVISLISLLLAFSLPRIGVPTLSDENRKVSQWLVAKTRALKESSLRDRKRFILHINIDSGKFWITDAAMSEEKILWAEQEGWTLPQGFTVLDVEYPDGDKRAAGIAEIYFTEKGYSSRVLIHIENDRGKRRSFLIEPFLTRMKVFDTYESFEG